MRIVLTGATGTIGQAVTRLLTGRGDTVIALSRDPSRATKVLGDDKVEAHAWSDPKGQAPPAEALRGADAVINLLGEPISQRWTDAVKQEIRDSRVLTTRQLTQALRALPEAERPRVLVSQSATGVYGPCGDDVVDESSTPGEDWLAQVVVAWEAEATAAADVMRVATTRTGVVLSESGGALEKMLPPFKLGVGGPVAGGKQYIPWIHLDDVVGGLIRALDDDGAEGAINLTAPNPVTNADFSRALGHALHRPAFMPVPGFAIKLLYGEMSVIVTTGQRALPRRIEMLGYAFAQPEVGAALQSLLN